MSTVLVTGAGGLIGKAVVELLLSKGFNVVGTDSTPSPFDNENNFSYVQCELTDKDKITGVIKGTRIDALVHLGCTVDNDFPDVLTPELEKFNAKVDKYLYKTAEAAGVKDILMLSTHQIYGSPKTREPIRETIDENPYTVYAKMKANSENALANALKKSSAKGVIMRICPVYTKDFVENLKSKVYDPKDNVAFVYGYGDYSYSFTCVYNIADFVYGILTSDSNVTYQGIYNVCDTKPIKAKDIVETLRADRHIGAVISKNYSSESVKGAVIFGSKASKVEYRYNELAIACSNVSYDNTKAQRISTFRWKLSNTK